MNKTVAVRLREVGLTNLFAYGDLEVKIGDYVIVEAERGQDYGQVISEPEEIAEETKNSVKNIVRIMHMDDLKQVKENNSKAKKAIKTCEKNISEHNLNMKLIDAEYSFDKSKIIFYFTAEGRIDFRDLVKDLAKIFKTRIEMRQMGVRDETRLFGGIGPCGRALCCTSFLRNFEPVTIKMAKEQNLPLNPTKISGICGRLMCCLSYEHKVYKELRKKLPKEGQTLNTPKGKARVLEVNPLKREVVLEFEGGSRERLAYDKDMQCEKLPVDKPKGHQKP
ncbi:MAG: stage 0 sporulation family protein [Candidatus Omnitrophica bacterium]|nr:stage 0 sporulation family protein [Candidatus Omnitrophota bacterium]